MGGSMKKYICVFMSCLLIINCHIFVLAAESETETDSPSIGGYMKYMSNEAPNKIAGFLFSKLGYVMDDLNIDPLTWLSGISVACGYSSWEDYVKANYDEDKDEVTFTKEFVTNFNIEFNNYLQETQGWYIEPACSQPVTWCVNHLKYYSPVVTYASELSNAFNDYGFVDVAIFSWNGNGNAIVVTGTNDYIVRDNNYYYSFYDENCEPVYNTLINNYPDAIQYFNKTDDTDPLPTFYNTLRAVPVDVTSACSGSMGHFVRFSRDTKVFKSVSALNDYLYGNKSIYLMSDISARLDEMTLGVNAFKYDWEKANKESLAAILKAIEENKTELNVDTLTEAQLQAVIDAVVSSRLDTINKTIQSGNEMNSFQNQLIYEKLEQIYQLILKWYNSQDITDIVDEPVLDVSLEGVVEGIDAILEELKAMHRSIVDIDLTVINNNTFNTEFDIDIMMQLQPSVDKMKTTFPFCLPWDVYYCFNSLAAEPVAPHWVIPICTPVGDYEIDVDLAPFHMLSYISRSLLTLTFIVYLSKFTFKLWEVF